MNTKTVLQLDAGGYFVGTATADESPLEPGVWLLPGGCVDAPAPEMPEGFKALWNGSRFDLKAIPKPEPEPEPKQEPFEVKVVTMRQARLALLEIGKLAGVQTALDALPEPTKTIANIEWEYSQEVQKDRTLVKLLAQALKLSPEDLTSLFELAASKL